MNTAAMSADLSAHHEAGHAVAALLLGVPFIAVRIVRGDNGEIGVDFKVIPWTSPCLETKLLGLAMLQFEQKTPAKKGQS